MRAMQTRDSGIIPATHFDTSAEAGPLRISTGDRILWRNPFGIGGITIAAAIGQMMVHDGGAPCVLTLHVEPSEPVCAVAEFAKEAGHYGEWLSVMLGDGGRTFVTGDTFLYNIWNGQIRLAAKDEASKAKDDAELRAMPEWWAERHSLQQEEDA